MRDRRIALLALLAAAGCSISDPREDAVLFDSPEERTNRDLFAVYYLESKGGGVASIVVPRRGPSESRIEAPKGFVDSLRGAGIGARRRLQGGAPVDSTHREAIEGFFAGLPAGASERTLPTDGEKTWTMEVKRMPPPHDGPETERDASSEPLSAKVRILHVSKTGEIKTLTIFKAPSKELPAGVPAGGATLETIDQLFLWLGRPKDIEFTDLGKEAFK